MAQKPTAKKTVNEDPRYAQALQAYEAGLRAMQEHKFDKAKPHFQKVIAAATVGDMVDFFDFFLIGFVLAYINAKFGKTDARLDSMDRRFDGIDKRFDDMRDLWRAELRRVEEVIDARLKHLEERG